MPQIYNFLVERPAESDAFEAGSHQRIADSILDTLRRDNVDVIGIEGELGSGKSTVIKLLEPKCIDSFEMIFFDVEKYQHGATKKALIETVFGAISRDFPETSLAYENTKNAKDSALGNRIKYDVDVNSRIDGWVFFFALSIIFAVSQAGSFLKGFAGFLQYLFSVIGVIKLKPESFSIDFLAIVSGIVLLIPCSLAWCSYKKKTVFGKMPPSPGNLLKRGGTDTVNELFEINKEVGAFELQQALMVFTDHISEDRRYILIIDNLDRVTDDKLREVWSDIDVFSAIAHNKIKLLIPYSHKHIASSLCRNSDEGREFISKRLPVTFRVSPVISADWLEHFENMLSEAIPDVPAECKTLAGQLISTLAGPEKSITPRYLKRLINAVVSIKLVGPEHLSVMSAFFYQLTVADEKYTVDEILNLQLINTSNDENNTKIGAIKRLDDARHYLLKSLDVEQFSRDIVAIHYQADHDIAESELLTKPLNQALIECNVEPFLSKQGIFGYERIVRGLFRNAVWTSNIQLLASMVKRSADSDTAKNEINSWLVNWASFISSIVNTDVNEVPLGTIDNVRNIILSGHEFSLEIFEREFCRLDAISAEFNKHEKYGYAELEKLHVLSILLNKKPKVITGFNVNFFKEHLWKHRYLLTSWNIESSILNGNKCFEMLMSFSEVIPGDLANFLLSQFKLGGYTDSKHNWVSESLPEVELDLSNPEEMLPDELYSYCLSSNWASSSTFEVYKTHVVDIEQPETRLVWDAQSVGLVIALESPSLIAQLSIESDADDLFIEELAKVLVVHGSVTKLLKALKDERTKEYAGKALGYLISQGKINRMGVLDCIQAFDALCELTGLTGAKIASWMDDWSPRISIDKNTINNYELFPESFVVCVIDNRINGFCEKFKQVLESDYASATWWRKQLSSPHRWVSIVINGLSSQKVTLGNGKALREAIEWSYSDNNTSLDKTPFESEWVLMLMSVLRAQQRTACLKHLSKVINEYRTKSETQIGIFRTFGKQIKFLVTSESSTQAVVNTVFEHCPEHIDDQDLNFSAWTDDNLMHFVHLLVAHEANNHIFPKVSKNQVLKKVRKKYERDQHKKN